jgi:hypothetical protein
MLRLRRNDLLRQIGDQLQEKQLEINYATKRIRPLIIQPNLVKSYALDSSPKFSGTFKNNDAVKSECGEMNAESSDAESKRLGNLRHGGAKKFAYHHLVSSLAKLLR